MKKCFIIMPFGDPFDHYYSDIIKPLTNSANFHTLRADEVYGNRPIIDDILEQIIDSDLIIADVSGKNPNVNYELGLAHALRKQVIIISQHIDDIPFDYRHLRTIIYDIAKPTWIDDIKKKITETIKVISSPSNNRFEIRSLNKFYSNLYSEKFLGLSAIFRTRQGMNLCLDELWKKPIKQLDIIAFGLKSFRDFRTNYVNQKVKEGMIIRILTINPSSEFLKQREKDEGLNENTIQKTIYSLIDWKKKITEQTNMADAIEIKCYDSIPLEFYWHQDDNIFIGPYLQGIDSQQTITYQFGADTEIGMFYSHYFDTLWNDGNFCVPA